MAIIREFPAQIPAADAADPNQRGADLSKLNATGDSMAVRLGHLLTIDSGEFLTDIGRARAFAQCFRGWLYYQPDTRNWVIWHDELGRWFDGDAPDGQAAIQQVGQEFLLRVRQIADDRRAVIGPDLLSARVLRDLIRLASHQPELLRPSSEFNTDPYLLGVANGVVDLRTGNVYERARESYVTIHCPVPYYSRRIYSDLWDQFLLDVTGEEDGGYRSFLRDYLGSLLCGHNAEERFTLLHGPGGTGKGTLIKTIGAILGPYAMTMNLDSLVKRPGGSIREDIASMAGKRLVFCPELTDDATLDLTLVKSMSGSDEQRARKLYQGGRVIRPTWSILVGANHWPAFSTAPDSGWWRRVVVLPFNRFPAQIDIQLKEKLSDPKEQLSILSWLIAGSRSYFRRGIPKHGWTPHMADTVKAAIAQYRFEHDPISMWMEECVVRGSISDCATNQAIMQSFYLWCEENDLTDIGITPNRVGHALSKAGYRITRISSGVSSSGSLRARRGLILRPPTKHQIELSQWDKRVSSTDFEV